MMEYYTGIVRALIPRKTKDIVFMSIMVPMLSAVGYKFCFPNYPKVLVVSETQYPKEVISGSYFFLNFDLQWNQTCDVLAKRYITASDGIEYLASEDFKQVVANERTRYTTRIPVANTLPYGDSKIRTKFTYGCDWFSRYVKNMEVDGRDRSFTIVGVTGNNSGPRLTSPASTF